MILLQALSPIQYTKGEIKDMPAYVTSYEIALVITLLMVITGVLVMILVILGFMYSNHHTKVKD